MKATNQAVRLWEVSFITAGLRTIERDAHLWILANDSEVAARKAKRFLKADGGINVYIKAVVQHGTVDVF